MSVGEDITFKFASRETYEKFRESFTRLVSEVVRDDDRIIDRVHRWEIDIDAAAQMDGVEIHRGPRLDENKGEGSRVYLVLDDTFIPLKGSVII